jgi:hypothetical protein
LIYDEDKEEYFENKVLVVNSSRNSVRNSHFYVSMKIMDKITHCCLINGGSRPNVMSRIIMEEIGFCLVPMRIQKIYWLTKTNNNLPLVKLKM